MAMDCLYAMRYPCHHPYLVGSLPVESSSKSWNGQNFSGLSSTILDSSLPQKERLDLLFPRVASEDKQQQYTFAAEQPELIFRSSCDLWLKPQGFNVEQLERRQNTIEKTSRERFSTIKSNNDNESFTTFVSENDSTSAKLKPKDNLWRPYLNVDHTAIDIKCPMPTYPSCNVPAIKKDLQPFGHLVMAASLHDKDGKQSKRTIGSSESAFRPVLKRKKHQCPFPKCDYKFFNNGQLSGHIRGHTGDKPFKCDYPTCDRAFARNEELTRHRRIHSGEKPHECDVCKKRFGRKDHLNKHQKTHLKTSEKRVYPCIFDGCGHSYTRSDALTRHLWTAHSYRHHKPPSFT